jgi:mannose-1-phosphate guanylyltransferase
VKAIILAAGYDPGIMPLALTIPKSMLPIVNKPVLEHIISLCTLHNITDIKINLNHLPEEIDHYFQDGKNFGCNISYSIEKTLAGTAGSLKRIQSFFDETFFVLMGDGLTNIDLTDMLRFHKEKGSKATVAVMPLDDPSHYGVVGINDSSLVTSFQEKPSKEDAKSHFISMGVYILEPEILQMIPAKEEYDFGRQLFPKLVEQNIPFFAYRTSAAWDDISSLTDYWRINMEALKGEAFNINKPQKEVKPGVYIHPTASVDKKVIEKAVPPIVVGENTEIASGVELIGPVVIGKDNYIDEKATISNSVILNNTYVGKGVEIKESIVNKNYHLSITNKFGVFVDDPSVLMSHTIVPFKTKWNLFLINATDRIVAFFALLCLSIPFAIAAILVKIDSPGPVFYISKRLRSPKIEKKGKHWYVFFTEKAVKYYVFRTMYIDADARVKELKNKYQTGPFVKIENDPRVTKIGNILRKTSFDELPLFWNVLKGDMSLVGIWALPTYEAETLLKDGLQTENGELDLSEVAQIRFQGRLGIAGFWQARGRSNLTAEERALHDSMQAVLTNLDNKYSDYLGEYSEFQTYKGYLKMLKETFNAVLKRTGAE